jgi:asparagine synthase (glutamine-hydrolysing)
VCGISGIIYRERDRSVSYDDLNRMCDTLIHRGPDEAGFFVKANVGLGMRRLKVIDLVTGHQPISNEDGSIWIIFNGEIYNYPQLRRALEQNGHTFSTQTDTETIVHAYEEYGEGCVSKLNGMFAFAIWDGRNEKLFLARDRLGVKPLYYFYDDHCLVFGSELKAILQCREVPRTIDREALDAFLTFEYIPAPLSIFSNVKKLAAGHTLIFQDGQISLRPYWDLQCSRLKGNEEELSRALYELLKDSVRMRLVSDVPLGVLLSGGIDSSSLVCLMSELMDRPVRTFSIGFDDPSYNELEYARTVAKYFGTDHHELIIQPDIVNLVSDLVRHLDEPLADVSIFPTYLVSKLARQHVTVVLSGDGGDELFGGYEWYVAEKIARYYRYLPEPLKSRWIPSLIGRVPPSPKKKGPVNKLKRFVEGSALPEPLRHFRWSSFLTESSKQGLYTEELRQSVNHGDTCSRFTAYFESCREADSTWQEQFADIKTYLADDILVKVDRMSMANSLEARTPYLDYRVAEFAAGLPADFKLRGLQTKYLLKRCMGAKLPPSVLKRKKEGFSIPMKNWLQHELKLMMEEVLSPCRVKQGGLFNSAYVEKLKADHLNGVANNSHQLWSLMVFEIWREAYLK